jgi:hypothetical protein
MICHQVTLSGDAEWPKVADAVIEASDCIPVEEEGIRLRRDNWVSVRYAEELNSAKSSVTL